MLNLIFFSCMDFREKDGRRQEDAVVVVQNPPCKVIFNL
jgi:hypothetical protein